MIEPKEPASGEPVPQSKAIDELVEVLLGIKIRTEDSMPDGVIVLIAEPDQEYSLGPHQLVGYGHPRVLISMLEMAKLQIIQQQHPKSIDEKKNPGRHFAN